MDGFSVVKFVRESIARKNRGVSRIPKDVYGFKEESERASGRSGGRVVVGERGREGEGGNAEDYGAEVDGLLRGGDRLG